MQKKILGICAALVAFAALAIAPTVASATKLTDTSGGATTTVGVGAKIIAIGTKAFGDDSNLSASGESITCTQNSLTGTVKQDGPLVEGTIEKATFSGEGATTGCQGGFLLGSDVKVAISGLPWCITTVKEKDTFTAVGADCGIANGKFTFSLSGNGLTCGFERTEGVSGTFTTPAAHEASTLSMNAAVFKTDKVTNHSAFCPSEGSINEMKFKLYTDTENGNYTKSEEDPVWFEL